jgi:endonuclease YncB( thermonuclease family)
MPMTLIKGVFRILNTSPDGDSIRFQAEHPEYWDLLERDVRTHRGGSVQLRLEGIDTLETHYEPRYGNFGVLHQPITLAHAAAAELLEFLGFERVTRQQDEEVTSSVPEEVPGYILSRCGDRNGRCVAFAFAGDAPKADGAQVRVRPEWIQESVNLHLLRSGLAYPGFFSKLYPELREEMAIAVREARENRDGVWEKDLTNAGFELKDLRTLTRDAVMLPKLFRRLIDYLANNEGSFSLKKLKDYLEDCGDRVYLASDERVTELATILEIKGQTLRLTIPPESLVFLEK